MERNQHFSVRHLVQASLLTALAVLLSVWPKFSIFPAVSWMKFELSDIPVLLGGFALGPVYGLAITVVKALLNALFTGDANWVGHIMNIVSSGVPTMIAALVYRANKTRKQAYIALAVFLVSQILVMIPMNYFVGCLNFVMFMGKTYAEGQAMIWALMGWICLFNLIKGAAAVLVTALVYKPLSRTVLSKDLLQKKRA